MTNSLYNTTLPKVGNPLMVTVGEKESVALFKDFALAVSSTPVSIPPPTAAAAAVSVDAPKASPAPASRVVPASSSGRYIPSDFYI